MMDWIRFLLAAISMLAGLFFVGTALFGVNKFRFVLNRMHAAALCDTLGVLFVLLGCIILTGFNMASLKYVVVIIMFWLAGPVCTHLMARLEVATDEDGKIEYEEEKR